MTSRSFIGERPVALGWGSTHYGGAEVGTLRGVDLPVWSQRECDDAYFQVKTSKIIIIGPAALFDLFKARRIVIV